MLLNQKTTFAIIYNAIGPRGIPHLIDCVSTCTHARGSYFSVKRKIVRRTCSRFSLSLKKENNKYLQILNFRLLDLWVAVTKHNRPHLEGGSFRSGLCGLKSADFQEDVERLC